MQWAKKPKCRMESTMVSRCKSGFFLYSSSRNHALDQEPSLAQYLDETIASRLLCSVDWSIRVCRSSHAPSFWSFAPDAHSSRLLPTPIRLFLLLPSSSTTKIFPRGTNRIAGEDKAVRGSNFSLFMWYDVILQMSFVMHEMIVS